jgi:hypothetical protein
MVASGKRFALLVAALVVVSVAFVACQATPPTPSVGASADSSGANVFRTPNPSLASPTPTFPPFTIGAWPSNYSPGNDDSVTIYVLCRVQKDMNNPPQPPNPPVTVTVLVGDPVGGTHTAVTDLDGLAAVNFSFTDPQSGVPVVVSVSATYGNQTYTAQTFFTPAPATKPSPSPSASPSTTATPGQ